MLFEHIKRVYKYNLIINHILKLVIVFINNNIMDKLHITLNKPLILKKLLQSMLN